MGEEEKWAKGCLISIQAGSNPVTPHSFIQQILILRIGSVASDHLPRTSVATSFLPGAQQIGGAGLYGSFKLSPLTKFVATLGGLTSLGSNMGG